MINATLRTTQKNFFDRAMVKNAVDAATLRVLSKFGAFVRQRAKTSIRKRKGPSSPGTPPHSHVGTLRENIFFAYDRSAGRPNVVIGPVLTEQSARAARARGGTVPKVLEEGGVIEKKGRLARIQARPYMKPAFEHEKKVTLPRLWKNSVR